MVSYPSEEAGRVAELCKSHGVPLARLGEVIRDRLQIFDDGPTKSSGHVQLEVSELAAAHASCLESIVGDD